MADGQVCWRELAFLLTTQRKLYDRRAGALSSSSQKSRIATGRTRAQKPACAYVQVGSYIANARGRSRSRAHGRWNDTGGSRRENVDNEECCFTSGERYVHPPDIDHHREICGSGGRVRRNPRADEAVALRAVHVSRRQRSSARPTSHGLRGRAARQVAAGHGVCAARRRTSNPVTRLA